jgi:cytochrome c-type biogenesis protein CcmH
VILGILVVVLTVGIAIALTRPWWHLALARRMSQRGANVAAYRTRLAEIDAEVAAGSLQPAAAEAMKLELQRRLVQDAEEAAAPDASVRSGWKLAAATAIFLPLFSGIWYYQAGSWRLQEQIARAPVAPAAADADSEAAQIEGMVQRLAQRLESSPDDAEGWAMLGRSYFVLKRYAESAKAYGRANALMRPQDPDLLISEGGALALAAGSDMSGRPRELFESALKASPDHARALWFSGQAAYQAAEFSLAQELWERLLLQNLPEEFRAEVEAHVHDLSAQTGRPAAVGGPAPQAASGPELRIRVQLSPAVQDKRRADQVLYVFAKAEQGPPMPLAVQKLKPTAWPVELTLDESMSMSPALKLSQFDRWVITARLGSEGSPAAQSGDLQGKVVVARGTSPQNVEVTISEQIP